MPGLDELRTIIAAGGAERTLVIAPRWTVVRAIQRDVLRDGGILFGLRATTPLDLLQTIAGARVTGKRISAVIAQELVGAAVTGLGGGTLPELLGRASGRRAAFQTIRELTLNGITPENLRAAGGELFDTFAILFQFYRELNTRNGLLDDAAWTIAAIESLEQDAHPLPQVEHLWVSGFPFIPWHIRRLLRHLARGKQLHLHLPVDEGGTGLFEDNRSLLDSGAWPDCVLHTHPAPVNTAEGALGVLQGALFAAVATALPAGDGCISFHRTPGRYDEAEAAAIRIASLLETGTPPARIAVSVRDLAQYDAFIREAFDRLRIPYAHRRGLPMLQSPPVRLILRLIEAGTEPLRWDRLIGIVQSAFLRDGGSPRWPEIIRATGSFRLEAEEWSQRLASFSVVEDAPFTEEDRIACADLIGRLMTDCGALYKIPTADRLAALRALCKVWIITDDRRFTESEQRTFLRHIRLFLTIVEGIEDDLRTMAEAGIRPSTDPFDLLRDALAQESIPEDQHAGEAVQVLNFYDMGYARVDHLFILGLDEQTVPRPPNQGAGIFGEREIERLAQVAPAAARMRTAAARRALEEQAFLLAVGSSRRSVHCYHRCYDEDGKEVTASPYFLELRRLAGKPPVRIEPGGAGRAISQAPPDAPALRRTLLRALYRSDITRDPALPAAYRRLCSDQNESAGLTRLSALIAIENRRERSLFNLAKYDRWSGVLEDESLRRDVAATFADDTWTWSQRALQQYADCPFGFFLDYILRLTPREAPLEDFDPRDIGSSLHRIIKKFTDATPYPITDPLEAQATMLACVRAEFERRFPGESFDHPGPMPRLWQYDLTARLRRFVAAEVEEQDWRHIESEKRFSRVTCVLDASGREIGLSGAFDRIDTDAGGTLYRVIDFKSGSLSNKTPKPEKVLELQNLQLPIYILAASALFEVDPHAIGAELYSLRSCDRAGIKAGDKKWAGFFDIGDGLATAGIRDIVRGIVEGAQSGSYPVTSLNRTKLGDYVNLVGRWLELPPELAESEGEA